MFDRLPDRLDSKFRFVLLAATRAEQLMRGARPKADILPRKATTLAMNEARHDLLDWDYGPSEEEIRAAEAAAAAAEQGAAMAEEPEVH
ncbi:MAG TPA: DNA-directed RNA polymerase subunit omega [Thermoanaerobaculia bacterium]|nr:DNA-directed RNA polymerase subunit omega [Thermoanaerobaculia bacterium]